MSGCHGWPAGALPGRLAQRSTAAGSPSMDAKRGKQEPTVHAPQHGSTSWVGMQGVHKLVPSDCLALVCRPAHTLRRCPRPAGPLVSKAQQQPTRHRGYARRCSLYANATCTRLPTPQFCRPHPPLAATHPPPPAPQARRMHVHVQHLLPPAATPLYGPQSTWLQSMCCPCSHWVMLRNQPPTTPILTQIPIPCRWRLPDHSV